MIDWHFGLCEHVPNPQIQMFNFCLPKSRRNLPVNFHFARLRHIYIYIYIIPPHCPVIDEPDEPDELERYTHLDKSNNRFINF